MRTVVALVGFACVSHGSLIHSSRDGEILDSLETVANLLLALNAPASRSRSGCRPYPERRSAPLEMYGSMAKGDDSKASDRHLKVAAASIKTGEGSPHETKAADAETASFEDAQVIGEELAKVLTESSVAGDAMPEEALTLLRKLVSRSAGARGWFVSLLTHPDFDPLFRPPIDESILQAISESPDPNIKLMTMNVAMPTATEITHLEMGNDEIAEGARMTRDRAKALVVAMLSPDSDGKERLPGLRANFERLLTAVQPDAENDGSGADKDWMKFCKKWGYNAAQREAVRKQIEEIVG